MKSSVTSLSGRNLIIAAAMILYVRSLSVSSLGAMLFKTRRGYRRAGTVRSSISNLNRVVYSSNELFSASARTTTCTTLRVQKISGSLSLSTLTASYFPFVDFERTKKAKIIFVLGGPGAGKGTQCEKLANDFGMVHLSAGELLRTERARVQAGDSTPEGEIIDECLREGKIVPVAISLSLLRKAILEHNCHRYLIDGFPRNWDNLQGWEAEASLQEICEVESVVFIDCAEDELEKRLLHRGLTSGRDDDNLETARKRFQTFKESTMPVVEYIEKVQQGNEGSEDLSAATSGGGESILSIDEQHQRYWLRSKLLRVDGNRPVDDVYSDIVHELVEPNIKRDIVQLNRRLLAALLTKDWPAYSKLVSAGAAGSFTSAVNEKGNEAEAVKPSSTEADPSANADMGTYQAMLRSFLTEAEELRKALNLTQPANMDRDKAAPAAAGEATAGDIGNWAVREAVSLRSETVDLLNGKMAKASVELEVDDKAAVIANQWALVDGNWKLVS